VEIIASLKFLMVLRTKIIAAAVWVVGQFCDFFLEKWTRIGLFYGQKRNCGTVLHFFLVGNMSKISCAGMRRGKSNTLLY